MKKKMYQQPEMKVVELESPEILAGSQTPSPQTESYEEVEESVTNAWYN